MKYAGFTVPKYLEPYFGDAAGEVIFTRNTRRKRAKIEVAYHLGINILDVTEQQIDDWIIFMLGLEGAQSAYEDVVHWAQQTELKRQEWERNNTCPHCATAERSAAQIEKETE